MFKPFYKASNLLISLDFDGVLAQGRKLKLKYAKEWYGINLQPHQTKKDGFNKLKLKEDYDQFITKIILEHNDEYEIPKDCVKILTKLKKEGFKFVITTPRINLYFAPAKKFIKTHFDKLIKKIYNTKDQPKDFIIKKIKPRIHIDDDLHKLEAIKNNPIDLIYYRQPENHHIDPKINNLHQINNWNSFYKHCHHLKFLHEAICNEYKIKNNHKNLHLIYDKLNNLTKKEQETIKKEYLKQNL